MSKIVKTGLLASLVLSSAYGAESSAVNVNEMFTNGKASGQVRLMYADYKPEVGTDMHATAVGGSLKYELAEFHGLNATFALTTSQDIDSLSGDANKSEHNNELSSSTGAYTELTEASINYSRAGFGLKVGRQVVDTPLADSDDIRMIANTFEAAIATYEIANFNLMAGKLYKWQGVDAGLDDRWVDTGVDGTNFGGISYSDVLDFNAWYYNIPKQLNATYADIGATYNFSEEMGISAAFQYLNESELENSGEAATITGAMAEISAYGLGLSVAYNKSDKIDGKTSFSGFGGGTLYTNMDIMIIDEITADRDASATVIGVSYGIDALTLAYAYGDFVGDADTAGAKAHIIEQNVVLEYAPSEELAVSAVYVMEEDKENIDSNWNHFRVGMTYNF